MYYNEFETKGKKIKPRIKLNNNRDILERRAIYCVEKKLWRTGLSLESFAKNLNRNCHCFKDSMEGLYQKNDPIWKKDIRLHSLQNCTALQHCCDIVSKRKRSGHRYSMNKIQFIFIKHTDVVAWVIFVTVNTGAFIVFTSWIWGFTAFFHHRHDFLFVSEKVGHLFMFLSPKMGVIITDLLVSS